MLFFKKSFFLYRRQVTQWKRIISTNTLPDYEITDSDSVVMLMSSAPGVQMLGNTHLLQHLPSRIIASALLHQNTFDNTFKGILKTGLINFKYLMYLVQKAFYENLKSKHLEVFSMTHFFNQTKQDKGNSAESLKISTRVTYSRFYNFLKEVY